MHQLINKSFTYLLVTSIALVTSVLEVHGRGEVPPEVVMNSVYQGIQFIHGSAATPRLYAGVNSIQSSCGLLTSSTYCALDHIIFIPNKDVMMAYEHGDAALAYIVAHEYAHAMQTAFGFQPSITPISELQADCLAGLYLGLIPNVSFDTSDLLEIGSLAHRLGDYTWGNQHHGTPQQRIKALSVGIDASSAGISGIRACMIEGRE